MVNRIGGAVTLTLTVDGIRQASQEREILDHHRAVRWVFDHLGGTRIDAVGHRVVHGGERFTEAMNVFVMVELFYLFNCRSLEHTMFHVGLFSNPWIWRDVSAMVGLQLMLTYLPTMNRLFHTVPIDGLAWLLILATAVIVYLTVGGEKWLRRRWDSRRRGG